MANNQKKILGFIGLLFIVGFLTFLVPQSIGLGAGGFDEKLVLEQFSFYLAGGIFMIFIVFGFFMESIIKKGDGKYGSSIAFSSLGENPAQSFFKRFSQLQVAFLSVIIFGVLGLFAFITRQETFTGIGTIEQQFTPQAQLLFSTFLVPGAENLGLALVIVASLLLLRFIARKVNMDKTTFVILATFVIPIIGAFYWLINHLLRYSGQDLNLVKVFLFGWVQSLLTIVTGSFIPAWILHQSNNLFFDLQRLFSSETVLITTIFVMIGIIALYSFIFKGRLLGKSGRD